VARRVLNRVVGAVLEDLRPLDDGQYRQHGNRGVAEQSDRRQHEQGDPHAAVLEDARDDECLKEEGQDVDRGLHRPGEGRDHRALVEPGARRRRGVLCGFGDQRVQHESTERVHLVEHQHHHRNHEQVSAAEHEPEAVALFHRLFDDRGIVFVVALATMDDDRERDWHEQPRGGDQHQDVRSYTAEECGRQSCSQCRAQRGADADERKQALASLAAVEIVGERPELRYRHHVEHADPDIERNADADPGGAERVEDQQVRREEQRDAANEPDAVHARRERAVRRNEEEQRCRHPR
jgi:hypothetical protein